MQSDITRQLLDAYSSGELCPPPTKTHAELSILDAYRLQSDQVRDWTAAGSTLCGYRVGQDAGWPMPVYGHLTASMLRPMGPPVPLGTYLQPQVNSGVAFLLRAPLTGPGTTVAEVLQAVEFVLPALEISDSRIDGRAASHVDAAADNAGIGGVILGTTPRPVAAIDLRLAGAVVTRNGEVAQTGAGGSVMHSPVQALLWLVHAGVSLASGQVVVAGSFTRPVDAVPGDQFTVSIAGIGAVTGGFAR